MIVESVARAYIRSLSGQDGSTAGETDVPLSITATQLEPTSTAANPSEPNLALIFAVGGILGLLLGAIAAYAVATAARRVSSLDQLSSEAGAPIMATVQQLKPEGATQTGVRLHWLAVRLGRLAREQSARSFALTSTRADDDVRELADQLVATLRGDGAIVQVVDLISRPPSKNHSWELATDDQSGSPEATLPLSADAMLERKSALESVNDLVLWLIEPVAVSADAIGAVGAVDETILVADRRVSIGELQEARAAMGFAGRSFAGVVVTSVSRASELAWSPFLASDSATSGSTVAHG